MSIILDGLYGIQQNNVVTVKYYVATIELCVAVE